MNLQGLKQKKMLHHLHTGSDLLAKGGYLLMKATDLSCGLLIVNDKGHWESLSVMTWLCNLLKD